MHADPAIPGSSAWQQLSVTSSGASPASAAPPRRRWWPVALVAALAVLVPGLVWFQSWIPSTAAVAYDVRAEGDLPLRGDTPPPPDAPLRLRPSTRLHVVLTPQKPIADAALRMLVVRDGKARLLRPSYGNDGQGTLTIDKAAREALGDQVDGPAELVWVVGRLLPDDAAIERIALDHSTVAPPWGVIVRRTVVFEGW
jgi:hypothetical protein